MKNFTQWNFFKNRRNIDLTYLIEKNNIKSYPEMKDWCDARRVICPDESEYTEAKSKLTSVNTKQKTTSNTSSITKKQTTSKRKPRATRQKQKK